MSNRMTTLPMSPKRLFSDSAAPPASPSVVLHASSDDDVSRSDGRHPKRHTPDAAPQPPKRPRGRPRGSKNKPKKPLLVENRERDGEIITPHILEVGAGCDVGESIRTFARSRHVGVCVMGAAGAVCNVTLFHKQGLMPMQPSLLHGKFEIVSLSGMLLRDADEVLVLNLSVSNLQGHVFGGAVGGGLVAAGPGPVVVMLAAFANASFHRFPGDEEAEPARDADGSAHESLRAAAGVAGDGTQREPDGACCAVPPSLDMLNLHWAVAPPQMSRQRF